MTIPTFQSLAEAEQYAASLGIRLSPADRDNIAKSQKAELNRLLS